MAFSADLPLGPLVVEEKPRKKKKKASRNGARQLPEVSAGDVLPNTPASSVIHVTATHEESPKSISPMVEDPRTSLAVGARPGPIEVEDAASSPVAGDSEEKDNSMPSIESKQVTPGPGASL